MDDFPAAHSMDTNWFAVDREGHVGLFFTGEDGHLPEAAAQSEGHRVLVALWSLRQSSADAAKDAERLYDLEREDRAARLGLFYYEHCRYALVGSNETLLGRYSRLVVPKGPLHLDQLPANLRKDCRTVCFERASFAGDEHLQPLDDHSCSLWNPWGTIAYLSADGTTVRPMPGHESSYEDFCARLREEYPRFAEQLRFESLPKKRGKGKRKGPGGKK
jgi:hypothetical protein